jgi:hypothetical protein
MPMVFIALPPATWAVTLNEAIFRLALGKLGGVEAVLRSEQPPALPIDVKSSIYIVTVTALLRDNLGERERQSG